MVDDAEVSGDELVLQARSIGDHDLVALVGNDNARSSESHALAEPHVSGNGQVVELGDVGDRLESLLEVLPVSGSNPYLSRHVTHGNLLELVSELDDGRSAELSALVHAQHTVFQVVKLRLDEEQVAEDQLLITAGSVRALSSPSRPALHSL